LFAVIAKIQMALRSVRRGAQTQKLGITLDAKLAQNSYSTTTPTNWNALDEQHFRVVVVAKFFDAPTIQVV
jgi:hypothetical protein